MATALINPLIMMGSPVGTAPSELAHDLATRWEAMQSARMLWDQEWQDMLELMMPGAEDITRWRYPGSQRTDRLFDSTAIMAAQTLAANLMGAVTNPAIQWFRLGFRDKRLKEDTEVASWLNEIDQIMLSAYNASNFYQTTHTFYLNLCVFGTAAMLADVTHPFHGGKLETYLRFRTLSTGTYCIEENSEGKVDTLFRAFRLSPRQAIQHFGEIKVSKQTREQAKQPGLMDKPKPFLHCVYPRVDYDRSKQGNRNMPFASVYLEADTRHICWESGYEEFPYLVARWETLGTAPWGFGPGHMAMPDVRTLNVLREMNLQMLALWAIPPLKAVQEGFVGSLSLESLAVNVMTRSVDDLATVDITGRPDLVQVNQEDLRKAIRDTFFADALAGLPPVDATQMTAYEVAQRIEMMQRLMGPSFTRLLSEMLDPLADRVFGLLWRNRALPPVPLQVAQAANDNQGQLDVEYEGPLARAQRGVEVKAIAETLAIATQIATATQSMDIYDNLDTDKMLKEVAEANGTPRHLMVDEGQVRRARDQRRQQQQQMQQAALANQQADTLNKAAPAMQAMMGQNGRAA